MSGYTTRQEPVNNQTPPSSADICRFGASCPNGTASAPPNAPTPAPRAPSDGTAHTARQGSPAGEGPARHDRRCDAPARTTQHGNAHTTRQPSPTPHADAADTRHHAPDASYSPASQHLIPNRTLELRKVELNEVRNLTHRKSRPTGPIPSDERTDQLRRARDTLLLTTHLTAPHQPPRATLQPCPGHRHRNIRTARPAHTVMGHALRVGLSERVQPLRDVLR